jgi:hypothetical protein
MQFIPVLIITLRHRLNKLACKAGLPPGRAFASLTSERAGDKILSINIWLQIYAAKQLTTAGKCFSLQRNRTK